MNLDLKMTQLALQKKNVVLIDLSFPETQFPEFRKNYVHRFVHLPCQQGMVLGYAAGLASLGKIVLIFGLDEPDFEDESLNVKVLQADSETNWQDFERALQEFGSSVLSFPNE